MQPNEANYRGPCYRFTKRRVVWWLRIPARISKQLVRTYAENCPGHAGMSRACTNEVVQKKGDRVTPLAGNADSYAAWPKSGSIKIGTKTRKICVTGDCFRRTSAKHLLACVPAYVHICILCAVSVRICPMPKTYHEDKKEKQHRKSSPCIFLRALRTLLWECVYIRVF